FLPPLSERRGRLRGPGGPFPPWPSAPEGGDRRWESRRPSLSCGGRRWSAPSRRLRGLRLRRTLFALSKHSGVSRPSGTKQRKVIGSNRYLFLAAQVEAHWQTLAHERLSFVIVNYRRLRLLL